MISEPTDWHQGLARVNGQLVHGEQRVTTHELLTYGRCSLPGLPIAATKWRRVVATQGARRFILRPGGNGHNRVESARGDCQVIAGAEKACEGR